MHLIAETVARDGFGLLVLAAVLAGLVRGFSGFGTAMVYIPFAAQVIPPVWVLTTLIVVDILGPSPAVPRALRDGQPRDVLRLGAGALLGMPLGVLLLTSVAPEVFRYAVSALTSLLLVALISGLRYRGPVPRALVYGTGALSGVSAGAVGMAGPPAIMLYMARALPVAAIRANIMLFLILTDILMLGVFAAGGLLHWAPVLIGACLIPPYLLSVWLGARLFDPGRETVYRWIAYGIIAVSVVNGLPIWD